MLMIFHAAPQYTWTQTGTGILSKPFAAAWQRGSIDRGMAHRARTTRFRQRPGFVWSQCSRNGGV